MYSIFSRNSVVAYALLVVLLVVMRLPLLSSPADYVVADSPELFSPAWTALFGHVAQGSTLSAVLAVTCMLLGALIAANIVNRYRLMPVQSALGGLVFVLFCGTFRPAMGFQPAHLFAIALVWALDRFFSATSKDRPYASIAWGMAIATFGALLYAKGIWFLPFLFVILVLLRQGGPRRLTAALVGVVAVLLVAFACVLFAQDPWAVAPAYGKAVMATMPYWRMGPWSYSYCALAVGLSLVSIVGVQRHLVEMKINESRRMRAAEWLLFFVLLLLLLPGFGLELQPIFAIGAALVIPRFLAGLSSLAREVIVGLIALLGLWLVYH